MLIIVLNTKDFVWFLSIFTHSSILLAGIKTNSHIILPEYIVKNFHPQSEIAHLKTKWNIGTFGALDENT